MNVDKTLYRLKIYRNCIKIRQNDQVQKDAKNSSKIWLWNTTKHNNTSAYMLIDHCYALGSICRSGCRLLVWRSFLKKGTPITIFCPALNPPMGGSGRKTTTLVLSLVRDQKYFIPTTLHQSHQAVLRSPDDDNGGTDDERRAMTMLVTHLSLWFRWAKTGGLINMPNTEQWSTSMREKVLLFWFYYKVKFWTRVLRLFL